MIKGSQKAPILDGTVLSKELTAIGRQIGVYFEYAGKIATAESEQATLVKTEQPAGLENYLKAVEKEQIKKAGKKLKPDELKALEESVRFVVQPKKIGVKTEMFKIVMHEITSENKHWTQLIKSAREEIEKICTQTGAIEKLQKDDVRDHL